MRHGGPSISLEVEFWCRNEKDLMAYLDPFPCICGSSQEELQITACLKTSRTFHPLQIRQFDIMGVECIVVGRTDSEAATLLMSNIDERDHAFILGATNASVGVLNEKLRQAAAKGASEQDICKLTNDWNRDAKVMVCVLFFPSAQMCSCGSRGCLAWVLHFGM